MEKRAEGWQMQVVDIGWVILALIDNNCGESAGTECRTASYEE